MEEHHQTNASIRIYVACLAAYNNGHLHGAWIDAEQEPEDIYKGISNMLAASPIPEAEEWAIHDYEGFDGLRLSEYEGIERVTALAAFVSEHEKLGVSVLEHCGGEIHEARTILSDHYAGEYEGVAAFAEQLTEETTDTPEHLRYYIDYERMGRDMALGGDIFTIETAHDEVHVFWER